MKVEDGSLRVRSNPKCRSLSGHQAKPLRDAEGFVDTGDVLELRGGRYYFVGRRDGVINIGGLKVHPEEVEAVINRHPQVQMSLVRTQKESDHRCAGRGRRGFKDGISTLTTDRPANCEDEILRLCREVLPRHKVPAAINFVASLGRRRDRENRARPCVTSS